MADDKIIFLSLKLRQLEDCAGGMLDRRLVPSAKFTKPRLLAGVPVKILGHVLTHSWS